MLGSLHSIIGRYDVRIDAKVMNDPENIARYEMYLDRAIRHNFEPFTYLDDLMDRAVWSGEESLWSVSLTDGANRWTGTVTAPNARNALFQAKQEFSAVYRKWAKTGTVTLTCM